MARAMDAVAVILEEPERLALRELALTDVGPSDVVVDVRWSGISSGTEKLLWTGQMPAFPGMGYPLVPGYESVGRIVDSGVAAQGRIGEWVFVPGASCFRSARGLFGGSAQRVIIDSARAIPVPESLGHSGTLLALAATAHHAVAGGAAPELVIGHGVLGRLIARITVALGNDAPTIWESNPRRRDGDATTAIEPDTDPRRDYAVIVDASGDETVVDTVVSRLSKGGTLVLAGFYSRIGFAFAPAFMRELTLRISAEFTADDMAAVKDLIDRRRLSLSGLISHRRPARDAADAYPQAFTDPACLKMVLDWSNI